MAQGSAESGSVEGRAEGEERRDARLGLSMVLFVDKEVDSHCALGMELGYHFAEAAGRHRRGGGSGGGGGRLRRACRRCDKSR